MDSSFHISARGRSTACVDTLEERERCRFEPGYRLEPAIDGHPIAPGDATMLAQDNLLAPDVLYDPYIYFAHLRDTDPVHWNERWGGWLILRYDDVVKILRDHETFSS